MQVVSRGITTPVAALVRTSFIVVKQAKRLDCLFFRITGVHLRRHYRLECLE